MNFNWNGCTGVETLIRKMILGNLSDLRKLFKDFGKERFQMKNSKPEREKISETEIIKNFPRFLSC